MISASWGQCESVETAQNADAEATLFEEAAAQGQTFVSASGDDGSEDCYTGGLLTDSSPSTTRRASRSSPASAAPP